MFSFSSLSECVLETVTYFTYINSVNAHCKEVKAIITHTHPILKMLKLREREVKQLKPS